MALKEELKRVNSFHRSLRDHREKVGTSDGLSRLSVGLENVDDLTEDLEQAPKTTV